MDSRSGTARSSLLVGVTAALLATGTLVVHAVGGPAPAFAPGSEPASATASQIKQTLSSLPLSFIENRGQMDPRVSYYVQGSTTTVYFTSEGLTFSLPGESSPQQATPELGPEGTLPAGWARSALEGATAERYTLKLDFVGADPDVRLIARDKAPGVVSYFTGPKQDWHTGLPTYSEILYPELWPGIDLVYGGTGSELKYTFHVSPGADPNQIRLAYRGASGLELNGSGELEVSTPATVLTERAPYTYQEIDGERVQVASGYAIGSGGSDFGFALGDHDPTRPLVIDPVVVVYAGYIGGASSDYGLGVAVDGDGSAYVTGYTSSSEDRFPVKVGPDLTSNGGVDAFVAKVDPSGDSLAYAGYIGGAGPDYGWAVAVDGAGSAYVTGQTSSSEDNSFPVNVGPDLTHNGGSDAFVAKVEPSGASLAYAGYIGGTGGDYGRAIAVDGAGSAYVTGQTFSTDRSFPVAVGPDLTYNGIGDAFVAKVESSGASLAYAGYIGGARDDSGEGIAVDGAGSAYVTGDTDSARESFPVAVGPDLTFNGGTDAFVAKVEPSGASLAYAGYIGGARDDVGDGVAVDAAGSAYIFGSTASGEDSFPVAVGPDLTFNGGFVDAFVAKVEPSGASLVYAGYIGGASDDGGGGVAVDAAGSAYVTGSTESGEDSFPVAVGPDLTYNGGGDAFVAKVEPSGASLAYAGYIGGTGNDSGSGVAVDGAGRAYVAGETTSREDSFPVKVGPDLTYNGGVVDTFVAKIGAEGPPPPACTITGTPQADDISGTSGDDVICALGGNDRVQARGGDDMVFGDEGADTLAGGGGADTLNGGPGSDVLRTTDGIGGNDLANGGPGEDTCIIDEGDTTRNCEVVEVR